MKRRAAIIMMKRDKASLRTQARREQAGIISSLSKARPCCVCVCVAGQWLVGVVKHL